MVVVKVEDGKASMWIDPTIMNGEPVLDDANVQEFDYGLFTAPVTKVSLYITKYGDQVITFDEVRVGNTYEEVVGKVFAATVPTTPANVEASD